MKKAPKDKMITKIKRTKRKFFFPEMGKTIEAESLEKAIELLKINNK